VGEIHSTLMMVIMVGTFWGIDRQQKIIGSQPMPLGIPVRKDTALQHLIVAVVNSGWHDAWGECQLLILIEEIVDVLVEHHSSNRLHINIHEACQYGHIYIYIYIYIQGSIPRRSVDHHYSAA